jgi:hypothetical protein
VVEELARTGAQAAAEESATERANMAWIVGTVQKISLQDGAPELPGFFVQEGSSPALALVFEDRKTAEECASAMKHIFDKALGIRGRV